MRKSTMELCEDTPISYLYGVGPKKAEAFSRLGIFTLRDLCYHFPRTYEDRGNVKSVKDACDGDICSLILTVASDARSAQIRRGMVITKVRAFDDTGTCNITFFNSPFLRDVMRTGATFRFYGKVIKKGNIAEMTSPSYEIFRESEELRRFVPIYPLTEGISQKQMISAVTSAIDAISGCISDFLPCDIREKYGLSALSRAISDIHMPKSYDDVVSARKRLSFDQLFLFSLCSMFYGGKEKNAPGIKFDISGKDKLLSVLPYSPTSAQERTMDEIWSDVSSGRRMSRIVTGDVGSGKTICAAYALFEALENGYQAALMAPTEILARQHFISLSPMFEKLGFECELLIGATSATKKRKLCERLMSGEPILVIGTHAIIEDNVLFSKLGLVVIDEQHRFGAAQREKLKNKSQNCHLLTMSATPIPRTLALVLYGDLDISQIDQMPPDRQKVDTFLVNESYRKRLDAFILKNVDGGGQVYIVCPSVEDQETVESESGERIPMSAFDPFSIYDERPKLKAAVSYADELSERLPSLRVGFIHGKLKSAAKEKVMAEFVNGDIDVLVSTTVIEVGVNVPRATLMIIENAETFGLSCLHQLRGRVGRGDKKSYCVFVSDSKNQRSRERLETLCHTSNGYEIAERDLELRGPGDFIAESGGKIRQSGEVDLGLAELLRDSETLYNAGEAAKSIYAEDPMLISEKNMPILSEITRMMKRRIRQD